MFVTVEGFGSIWSKRTRRGRIAYYNTTGICFDGELHHRSQPFGQIRFNEVGGFNPNLVDRNIGRVFACTGELRQTGACLLLHHVLERPLEPDYFLFTVTSERTGFLPIGRYPWKSDGVLLISFSQFQQRQEAMVLMPAHSWIRGALGWFITEPVPNTSWRAFLRLVGV
jgi:hypothetical protein